MTHEMLTSAFGWMTVLNMGFLIFSTIMVVTTKNWASALHARLFDLDQTTVRQTYYTWLGTYKIMILVFALVPYLALRMV